MVALLICCSSCVTHKKYVACDKAKTNCEAEVDQLRKEVKLLIADKIDLTDKARKLSRDTVRLNNKLKQNQELLVSTRELLNANEKILSEKMKELSERETLINALKDEIDTQNAKTEMLFLSLTDALKGFDSLEISASTKDGEIYMQLSDNFLFQSRSNSITRRGERVIITLTELIKAQSFNIVIIGHVAEKDNNITPFKGNWEMSMNRALSVAQLLVENNINPKQISISGRDDRLTDTDNDQPENSISNRGIEIIISPQLKQLFEIINQ